MAETWQDFTPTPRPKSMRRRAGKGCFLNALHIVIDGRWPEYVYAEGVAVSPDGQFAVHHAWVVDLAGNAIDPTWEEPGQRYLGRTWTDVRELNLGGPSLADAEVLQLYDAIFADEPSTSEPVPLSEGAD